MEDFNQTVISIPIFNAISSQIMSGVGEHFDPEKKRGTSYHQMHEWPMGI